MIIWNPGKFPGILYSMKTFQKTTAERQSSDCSPLILCHLTHEGFGVIRSDARSAAPLLRVQYLLCQIRHDLLPITHNAIIRNFKNRSAFILIDSYYDI